MRGELKAMPHNISSLEQLEKLEANFAEKLQFSVFLVVKLFGFNEFGMQPQVVKLQVLRIAGRPRFASSS